MVKVVSQFGLSRAHVVDEGSCVASGGRLISHIDKMQQTDKSGFPRLFYSSLIDAKDDIEDVSATLWTKTYNSLGCEDK